VAEDFVREWPFGAGRGAVAEEGTPEEVVGREIVVDEVDPDAEVGRVVGLFLVVIGGRLMVVVAVTHEDAEALLGGCRTERARPKMPDTGLLFGTAPVGLLPLPLPLPAPVVLVA